MCNRPAWVLGMGDATLHFVRYIAYALLSFGCFVSLVNFYLSVLRYPLFRLRGNYPPVLFTTGVN